MNWQRSIEEVLFPRQNYYAKETLAKRFLWTYDSNGPCSGLWIARTDQITEGHLRYAYEHAAMENNVRHGKIEPYGISDQDSMTRLMLIPPFKETFNNCSAAVHIGHCYPENYTPGKWILTFPGVSAEEKLAMMKQYAPKAVELNTPKMVSYV